MLLRIYPPEGGLSRKHDGSCYCPRDWRDRLCQNSLVDLQHLLKQSEDMSVRSQPSEIATLGKKHNVIHGEDGSDLLVREPLFWRLSSFVYRYSSRVRVHVALSVSFTSMSTSILVRAWIF